MPIIGGCALRLLIYTVEQSDSAYVGVETRFLIIQARLLSLWHRENSIR